MILGAAGPLRGDAAPLRQRGIAVRWVSLGGASRPASRWSRCSSWQLGGGTRIAAVVGSERRREPGDRADCRHHHVRRATGPETLDDQGARHRAGTSSAPAPTAVAADPLKLTVPLQPLPPASTRSPGEPSRPSTATRDGLLRVRYRRRRRRPARHRRQPARRAGGRRRSAAGPSPRDRGPVAAVPRPARAARRRRRSGDRRAPVGRVCRRLLPLAWLLAAVGSHRDRGRGRRLGCVARRVVGSSFGSGDPGARRAPPCRGNRRRPGRAARPAAAAGGRRARRSVACWRMCC